MTAILLYIHLKYKRANIVYLSQWQSECWTWIFLFALLLSLLAAGVLPGWLVIILGVEGVGKRMRLGKREGSDKFYGCMCVREREDVEETPIIKLSPKKWSLPHFCCPLSAVKKSKFHPQSTWWWTETVCPNISANIMTIGTGWFCNFLCCLSKLKMSVGC